MIMFLRARQDDNAWDLVDIKPGSFDIQYFHSLLSPTLLFTQIRTFEEKNYAHLP